MGRVVVHIGKDKESVELERKMAYFNLSPEERMKKTFQLLGLTMLFTQDKGEKRSSVLIKKFEK